MRACKHGSVHMGTCARVALTPLGLQGLPRGRHSLAAPFLPLFPLTAHPRAWDGRSFSRGQSRAVGPPAALPPGLLLGPAAFKALCPPSRPCLIHTQGQAPPPPSCPLCLSVMSWSLCPCPRPLRWVEGNVFVKT